MTHFASTLDSRPALRLGVGMVASGLVHAAVLVGLLAGTRSTDVGLSFELPDEVELGLTDEAAFEPITTEPAATVVSTPETATPPDEPGPATVDAGRPDAGARDAGPPDAGPEDAGAASTDAGVDGGDAGIDGGASIDAGALLASADAGASRLPPGAQIAMRLDMARIRSSPLAPDIRRLLERNPDWQALLAGSGINPVDALDRVMVASPNLSRSRWVIAGRTVADTEEVRAIVARMARARGTSAPWRVEHGVHVAPWEDEDPTDRLIALVPPRDFTICRPEDLPRVLAIAQARQQEEQEGSTWAEALLSMGEGEAMSFEVEGARRFARAGPGVPEGVVPMRVRVSVTQDGDTHVVLAGTLGYESAEQARQAHEFWDAQRNRLAADPAVAFLGLARPLADMTLVVEESTLRLRTRLGMAQTRLAIGYIEGQLAAYAARNRAGRAPRPPP